MPCTFIRNRCGRLQAIAAVEHPSRARPGTEAKHNVQPASLQAKRRSLRHVGLYTLHDESMQ